ncbi:MAG TPA: proteasome accessory factor PafA2 family protein [Candidatus Nanoarchaeia archaeon]|nr:proteasome accessory factor PafA2 family protein [Candidatus Nanoarchaeia archaeon]
MKPRIVGLETEYGFMPRDERLHERRYNLLFKGLKQRFLQNGGRLYLCSSSSKVGASSPREIAHPEYATPECLSLTLKDIIAYDKAGERIIVGELPGFRFFKNNCDESSGVSDDGPAVVEYNPLRREEAGPNFFGCHENYSIERGVFLAEKLIPFLATRAIFTGNGFISRNNYYLSQKSMSYIQMGYLASSILSVHPSCNSLAYASDYGRLEIKIGDANMCEMASYLKTGLTCLILDLAEGFKRGNLPEIHVDLRDVYDIFTSASSNLSCKGLIKIHFKGSYTRMSAIDVQRIYLEKCKKHYAGMDLLTDDLLGSWSYALDSLEKDPMGLKGWFDWIEKKRLLNEFMLDTRLGLDDPWVRSVALNYHDIGREDNSQERADKGLYYALQDKGRIIRIVDENAIERAMSNPPENTRAWKRAKAISDYGVRISEVYWDTLCFDKEVMSDPFFDGSGKAKREFMAYLRKELGECPKVTLC